MLEQSIIEEIIQRALHEDLGEHACDITSDATVPADMPGKATINAREAGVLAGIDAAIAAFTLMDVFIDINKHKEDGDVLKAGDKIFTIDGYAKPILTAERTALNIISHLSGIATETSKYVAAVKGTDAKIMCTRKTLPGLRELQKYAVLMGGATNHRFGLYDAILIKDNHIAFAGGVGEAIKRAKDKSDDDIKIEIEVDTLEQLEEVLNCGVDIVLLDNMDNDTLKKAVAMVGDAALTEASGGVNLATVKGVAETGVDMISVGALTHSVKALDMGLDTEANT